MSKKKPRSKDPHSWIRDTTKKAEEPEPARQAAKTKQAEKPVTTQAADETHAGPGEAAADSAPAPKRFIAIQYDKKDGRIFATHEVISESQESATEAPAIASEDTASARIALTGELLDKKLIDIHENYKVVISKTKPTLVPKD
ncbi:MAG TPA: hypothetical protein VGX92_17300 [Pyrinomonadaceae bacterium]|jgi:hypothetical protein|nr:hypothetical protein [Pyrinomonadaceae bacterium]